jgi:hypothetical protein
MRVGLTCANSVSRVDAVDSVFLFMLVPVFSQINHKKRCSEASKYYNISCCYLITIIVFSP